MAAKLIFQDLTDTKRPHPLIGTCFQIFVCVSIVNLGLNYREVPVDRFLEVDNLTPKGKMITPEQLIQGLVEQSSCLSIFLEISRETTPIDVRQSIFSAFACTESLLSWHRIDPKGVSNV